MFLYKHFTTNEQRKELVALVTQPDKDTPAQVPGVTAKVLSAEEKVEFQGKHGPIDQLRTLLNPTT